jgi:FdhD protein
VERNADTVGPQTRSVRIELARGDRHEPSSDRVAVEEPLEIRLAHAGEHGAGRAVSVTMRTPGQDPDLAAGFLFGEGLLQGPADLVAIRPCGTSGNVVRVELAAGVAFDPASLERHFYTSSSCGVCGKSSIEAVLRTVRRGQPPGLPRFTVSSAVLATLPDRLQQAQDVFATTGGLHAAGLFTADGRLLRCSEDVGRHNAVDKLVGAALRAGELPLHGRLLMLSGRASFELLQKAMLAGLPLVAAIGAPSSLAIELAEHAGITLVGFLRGTRFNVYSNPQRIAWAAEAAP